MIKKMIFTILIGAAALFAASSVPITDLQLNQVNHVNLSTTGDGFEFDEHIPINVVLSNDVVNVTTESNFKISDIVIEYVDSKLDSRLGTFMLDVNNNVKLPIQPVAVKVHQVLTQINQVKYRYTASSNNVAPSNFNFNQVKRIGFVDIETRTVKSVNTDLKTSNSSIQHFTVQIYEFYFDFNERHDELLGVDVQYVFDRYYLGIIQDSDLVEENRKMNQAYTTTGWEYFVHPYLESVWQYAERNYVGLEVNTDTSINGQYVVRVSPSNKKLFDAKYVVRNFAIIRVEYIVDGEHKLEDVINAPVTPDEPIDNFDWFYKLFADVKNFFDMITSFFGSNLKILLSIVIGVVALALLGPVTSLIKLIFTAIKSAFKGIVFIVKYILKIPGKIVALFKYLFVPNKKKKRRRYK